MDPPVMEIAKGVLEVRKYAQSQTGVGWVAGNHKTTSTALTVHQGTRHFGPKTGLVGLNCPTTEESKSLDLSAELSCLMDKSVASYFYSKLPVPLFQTPYV